MAGPAGSRITSRGLALSVLILGCQKDGPLLNCDGGDVRVAPGRVDRCPENLRPARRASFRLQRSRGLIRAGEHPASWRAASRVTFAGTPPVTWFRAPSEEIRDGGNALGRPATHGQHGVVWVRHRLAGTSGSFWAERLRVPARRSHGLGPPHPGTGLARRRRARSAVTMRWSQVRPRAWSRLTWSAGGNQDLLPGARSPFSRLPVNDTVPPRPQPVSASEVISRSFVGRLVPHEQRAGVSGP